MNINDPAHKSLNLLFTKVSSLIGEKVFLPDLQDSKNPSGVHEHVLATGLFYQRVFELNYWPTNDFYLYCLSPAVKNVLTQMLHFDEDVVSVIPRYKLMPKNTNEADFSLPKNFTLVHAGRISAQKNIEFVIFVHFYFQLLYSAENHLLLLGEYDNEQHRNLKGLYEKNYEDKINQLIGSLPWPGRPPEIIQGLGTVEWLEKISTTGAFFSASNLISEDFSMAVAQVQQSLNIPGILPKWGAFKDVHGKNIRLYDSNFIASSNETLQSISSKAKQFVLAFVKNELLFAPSLSSSEPKLILPRKINRDYLAQKIELNKKHWGKEVEHIINGNFSLFTQSAASQKFFEQYFKIFS